MNTSPEAPAVPLPVVRLGPGCEASRLMIGSNPMSGFSHWSPERDRAMNQYYTAARTLDLLRHCQALGLSSVLLRGDRLMCRLYRDFCLEGGKLAWVAQTASELADQAVHVKSLAGLGAAGIYVHGTWVDNLFHAGRQAEVRDLLKRVRDTGKAVGLGTHRPEVVAHAEGAAWDLDFYMACFYNLAKAPKQVVAVAGCPVQKEEFDPGDPPRMTAAIRATKKPCLAFKVLGAGRHCASPEAVHAAFAYAYANIKPTDAVVVGVFQQEGDQLAADVAMVRKILSER